ncbi:50S ribosomal protein L34 [Candidatus Parcubacteria bacterium]|nr:50S ribosomal protein L34 [Candidatus Parcubacteria bacterium]
MSRTYQPKKRKRARAHGFLSRKKTSTGKRTLRNRMRKGRKRVAL